MDKIQSFKHPIDSIAIPNQFTFPHYYTPHPLAKIASKELQEYLMIQRDFDHNFGLDPLKSGLVIGKMFGVLVVQKNDGTLGYLAAFSGKLAEKNHHAIFVPPVFDLLSTRNFFIQEETFINQINSDLERLQSNENYKNIKNELEQARLSKVDRIKACKEDIKKNKKLRKEKRLHITDPRTLQELNQQSIREQYYLKDLIQYWDKKIENLEQAFQSYETKIQQLKTLRKVKSNALQNRIFDSYTFLNSNQVSQSLLSLFKNTPVERPPAGAGECAAPKLLQYAYLHKLKPICMAEFWWGASPKSQVRKHKQFYPACRSKCEPILEHMLLGLPVEPNPIQQTISLKEPIPILYEDDYLLVLNKPHEFLSVPGKTIKTSVYTEIKKLYPNATGPLLVHRLDMSTSGILLVAKTKEVHKSLQYQFIKRTIKKRYTALLENKMEANHGFIDLPLRVDLDNRPAQLVCYEHGKAARTFWEFIKNINNHALVHFHPITGRTHQLRVHAAHVDGLNNSILGDDIYGNKKDRLYLHAAYISFQHPISRKQIEINCKAPFEE